MHLVGLHSAFRSPETYRNASGYRLLPMRFTRLDSSRYVVSGFAGDYAVVSTEQLGDLVNHRLPVGSELYDDLLARHLIADDSSSVHRDLLSTKYRTRQARLPDFTSLHLFVVTLRCDHSCHYCQVSRVSEDRSAFDMTEETASRAIDLVFRSPSPHLKIEFQGGESLLNFSLVRYVVEEARRRNDGRHMTFVITSNLANLTDEMLDYCEQHHIEFSTSLDGPAALHNRNRPRPGNDSYDKTIEGIARIRDRLGNLAVSALMTTTAASLEQPEAIIDEYVRQGFPSIFLRFVSPYGFAVKSASRIGYETEQFIQFFKRGLAHVLKLNKEGVRIRESYTQLLLQRILTPFATGYVDLQSPAGMGLSALVYNYDGGVYASDEGRMLAEMGDEKFRLGHVEDGYERLFLDSPLLAMSHESMSEGVPGCSECAFQPYCGTDPVFHHRTQGDFVGHRPTSGFCKRNMELMRHVLLLLEDDPTAARILRSWV